MKNKASFGIALLLLLLAGITSCTIKPKNLTLEKDNIVDAYWMLVSVEGQGIQSPNNTRTAYLRLEEKESDVSGFTGCNRLSGRYTLDGQKLKLSELRTTRMACTETETENKMLDVLRRADNYRISGDLLTLFEGTSAVATFRTGNPDIIEREGHDELKIKIKD
ncbi:META domain-containing protein [Pontibacter sp. E15-1]|uniref:META domain-containing protein n=1 Tax=Pontibacter sp. E15-1 TaxID=2919918 RepID=UPI001F4FDBB2|nr:META domain-containing protein [Pontibacter sp. E15-1]MCJ8167347.1 META domain-containing protein [Pontibacter sp. E15-1]